MGSFFFNLEIPRSMIVFFLFFYLQIQNTPIIKKNLPC